MKLRYTVDIRQLIFLQLDIVTGAGADQGREFQIKRVIITGEPLNMSSIIVMKII